ncbi:MAG: polyamine aminopropyltransferase [Pseudomonadota bacterium]
MVRSFRKNAQSKPDIVIGEQNGVRSLHLGGSMIQSAMRVSAPNDLELLYTRCMMGFLLFHPTPSHILMIGLGGGSLAKFTYHEMPETCTTVIEINQQVISTAINYFALPEEDERFKITLADGAQYILDHPDSADIVMIDGFDDGCQVASLCSQEFYNQTCQSLRRNGILVVNLLSRDKQLNTYLQRIEAAFNGHVAAMLSEIQGNLIVFAFQHSPGRIAWKTLKARAKALEQEYALPFSDFVFKLRKHSACHGNFLEI